MSATIARPQSSESSHFYYPDGAPCYEVPNKSNSGMRRATVADAKKLGLVPSVTTVLKEKAKPELTNWLCEQACLAVLTTPRLDGEGLDAFVERVLHTDRVQDEESQKARDRGIAIHDAIQALFQGRAIDPEVDPWVRPAFEEVSRMGELVCTEKALANAEFGGMIDLVQQSPETWILTDWKTTKKLPTKGAWSEHVLQLAAYARLWLDALSPEGCTQSTKTQNVYISTVECGKFVICQHEQDWYDTYVHGFAPLVEHWKWANGFV